MARNDRKRLELPDMDGNGWTWLETARNDWKWLEMAGNGLKWLEMQENDNDDA